MVRSGLVTAWRLAGCPTSRSPSSVKARIEGVVRMPSAFSITFGVLPSITATHELVVPRSIPMTLPMSRFLLSAAGRPGPFGTRTESPRDPRSPLIRPPKSTSMPPPGGVLAHIGGRVCPARHMITDSRAAGPAPGRRAAKWKRARRTTRDRARTSSLWQGATAEDDGGMTAARPLSGFRLVAGYLDRPAQEALLAALRAVFARAPLYTPRMPNSGKPLSVRMTNCGPLGWVSDEAGYRYQPLHPQTGQPWPPMPD